MSTPRLKDSQTCAAEFASAICLIKYYLYVCTSHVYHFRCERKPVRAWAPGRAPENQNALIFACTTPKNRPFLSKMEIKEKLPSTNAHRKQIFLDLSFSLANAPWSEIIYFWATTQIRRLDREKSPKKHSKWKRRAQKIRNHVLQNLPLRHV